LHCEAGAKNKSTTQFVAERRKFRNNSGPLGFEFIGVL
jgi:hypothetical protein